MSACPRCATLAATIAWSERMLRRMLELSPNLDVYDHATIRAVAEALSARNPKHKTP